MRTSSSSEAPPTPRHIPLEPGIYDRWWWITTLRGLVPPGPPPPWLQEYSVFQSLADLAASVAPHLRDRVLEIALEQLNHSASTLKGLLGGERHE